MGVFTTIGTTFESAISGFTATTASGVIGMIAPMVLVGVTLYFTITGYMIMAGRISEPLADVMIKGAKIALIAMVGLSTGDFMTYVAGAATGLEKEFLSAMGSSSNNIYQLMDDAWFKGIDVVSGAFEEAGNKTFLTEATSIIVLTLSGSIGLIALVSICTIGAGIVMMAKMALVIVLGFGPLFICALMFPATANWFYGWLSAVLNYIFTAVVTSAILIIFINIFVHYVNQFSLVFDNLDAEGSGQAILLYCVVLLLVSLISAYVTHQAPTIAAAMSGGVAMGASGLMTMVKNTSSNVVQPAGKAAASTAKMTYGAANIATRGDLHRGVSSRLANVSNRYMKQSNSMNG